MGLILRPSEIESGVQQIRSELNNMKDGYSGVMQAVLGFSGNEALQSQSWNGAKERIWETHQCIVQGMWAVQTIMGKDLDSLGASMDGAEDLDEDELLMQIENLAKECEFYEIMIRMYQSMQVINNICKPDITSSMGDQIEHYQKLLKQTEEELELLKTKLQMLFDKADETSGLFQEISALLGAIDCAINDAVFYITGRGKLSGENWREIISTAINEINIYNSLNEVFQVELGINIEELEALYGKNEIEIIKEYMINNSVNVINNKSKKLVVIKILEQLSGNSVKLDGKNYQFKRGDSTVVYELTADKVKQKIKMGSIGWNNVEVIIPQKVDGIINDQRITFYPLENWGTVGKGNYGEGVQKDLDGKYKIAVGPKILDPNYPSSGKLWKDDFVNLPNEINLVLENKNTGEKRIIECVVNDCKAHTYNTYPDGQSYDTGDHALFNIDNGLIQTGIAYPNSVNASKNKSCSVETMSGTVIEFTGQEIDFNIYDYRLEEIIILEN